MQFLLFSLLSAILNHFPKSTLFHAFLLRFQPFYEARQGDLRKPKARILVNQIALYYGIELLVDRPNHSVWKLYKKVSSKCFDGFFCHFSYFSKYGLVTLFDRNFVKWDILGWLADNVQSFLPRLITPLLALKVVDDTDIFGEWNIYWGLAFLLGLPWYSFSSFHVLNFHASLRRWLAFFI